ncbi:hypothetical protein XI07_09340 [Bradyrhizobium sp. CCBAU 11445]|nr:hypothetical protein [Bradyrhizobium sp. CCBAU 11445]MDA9522713.1 hypothetical protein [Bradyrhizobium sp. CCBAU 11434]
MVVEGLLAPYHSNTERLRLSGPAVELESKQALSLLMTIHELATNAVKHGVLSWDDGYILSWAFDGKEFCFSWRESGGPIVTEPTRRGSA